MLPIIKYRFIWFIISSVLFALSTLTFLFWGLDYGIDFTGGSLLEIEYARARPQTSEVGPLLREKKILENVSVQISNRNAQILRFETVSEDTHQQILKALEEKFGPIQEKRFDSIGPLIGQELKTKTIKAVVIAVTAIILYIAWVFRRISKLIPSWHYGIIAALALVHDIMIVIGVFSFLGKFYHIEVNAPFVAALLTVLGYSVNDTIVVFDRTRENLSKSAVPGQHFEDIIEKSVQQTMKRSINTSLTTLLALLSIFFFGGQTLRSFSLVLILGIIVGTYSSIFIASPLLVVVKNKLLRK